MVLDIYYVAYELEASVGRSSDCESHCSASCRVNGGIGDIFFMALAPGFQEELSLTATQRMGGSRTQVSRPEKRAIADPFHQCVLRPGCRSIERDSAFSSLVTT